MGLDSGVSEVWGSVHAVSDFEVPGLRVRLGVSVSGVGVVAGSSLCVDVLRLSALVATDGKM